MTDKERYHIPKEASQPVEDRVRQATRQELDTWANDPRCFEKEICAAEMERRQNPTERSVSNREPSGQQESRRLAGQESTQTVQAASHLQGNSFNPRTEVSADAKYIASQVVRHLWIIFVLLPFVAVLLLYLVGAIK